LIVFDVSQYPPAVGELLVPEPLPPLDAGRPNEAVRPRLAALTPAEVVGRAPADPQMAAACLSGLWLLHNFLDESHTLSQDIHTPTGSFWHGIMHRREGDYDNAKYWFRRVGEHPAYAALHAASQTELRLEPTGPSEATRDLPSRELLQMLTAPRWDPLRFVDATAAACRGRSNLVEPCRRLQRLEWETLFDFCFVAARGGR
jgi:hypothetical protein